MLIFSLTPKQQELRDKAASPARHVLAYGGSRSGKTFGFCYCVAVRALSAPESRHLIARLHNIDVRQAVMMDTWPAVMRAAFPGVGWTPNRQGRFITLPNGSEVWFGGLRRQSRIRRSSARNSPRSIRTSAARSPTDDPNAPHPARPERGRRVMVVPCPSRRTTPAQPGRSQSLDLSRVRPRCAANRMPLPDGTRPM